MAKATKKNITKAKTTTPKTRTATGIDPIFALIENHRKLEREMTALYAELDEAETEAQKKHGDRPSSPVRWRDHMVTVFDIGIAKQQLVKQPNVNPTTIENEYWAIRARLIGTELGRQAMGHGCETHGPSQAARPRGMGRAACILSDGADQAHHRGRRSRTA